MKVVLVIVLACLISFGASAKFPKSFKKCKVSPELDNKPNECLKSAVQDAIRYLSIDGSEELGVGDFDPLRVDRIEIDQGEGPVSINYIFLKSNLTGLRNSIVDSIDGKLSSASGFNMLLKGYTKIFEILGQYKINGRMLILPIQGEGYSNLSISNLKFFCNISGDSQIKHGKEYLKITDFKLQVDPGKITFNFENLFNGNKELGDNMIKFMNENWSEIYKELRHPLEEAFGLILKSYTQRILERVSFKKIFIT